MAAENENTLVKRAYAKINLGLDVLRRREDGYHEVKMIMQTVSLYDILTFTKTEEGIAVVTDREELPGDESNLVYKAAKLLADTYGIKEGIKIELCKRIPMAAGMAGGSTDAAAVFRGMNELFGLGMTEEEMCVLAVKIGADVPYCIQGGTALAEGIGEALTKLPDAPDCFLLIAKPDMDVSTRYVYENLHANELRQHPDIDGMRAAIEAGDLEGIVQRMENVLETVTIKKYPVIQEIKDFMKENGAVNALMSGSGPTVFGVFRSEEAAGEALRLFKLKKAGLAGQLFTAALTKRAEVE
jgi:4-diphosphocytidyl-2C-methyl-D-erythritol kinase